MQCGFSIKDRIAMQYGIFQLTWNPPYKATYGVFQLQKNELRKLVSE